jgi:antitoxin component YwqK of YwqJK toxin-antitoxin module
MDKLILIEIINASGDKKEMMAMYLILCQVCKRWYSMLQLLKDYFGSKWLSWYHNPGTVDETYQGYHFEYKHGKYFRFKYFPDGYDTGGQLVYLQTEGEYLNNLRTNTWFKRYRTGQLKAKETYLMGKLYGTQYYYTVTGKLMKVAEYNHLGKLDGLLTIFKNDGNIISRTHWSNGKKNGKHCVTMSGAKFNYIECEYTNDLLNGVYTERWPNKKIRVKAQYVNGLLDGLFLQFHTNGKLHVRQTYNNGRLNGKSKMWWQNGALAEELEFNNGNIVSL